ncbi:MAG: cysteine hydrolase [Candidatus Lambdaproteobacteria bacterium]|nr:cysteine hydrolase [Candidatus Lambdaproteobacteria bacterium]
MGAHELYLVMDMINDLIHADGPNGNTGFGPEVRRRNIIANTRVALAKARQAGVRVGYVRVGFSPDYRECPPGSPAFSQAKTLGRYKLGTWGTEVHPELAPLPGDFDIVKHRVSPFYGTSLEPILRANGIRRLYLSGVSTNGVVHSAVREGHDRDYECVVIDDCCCALSEEEHRAGIGIMKRYTHGVLTAAELRFGDG